ncbi:MAG: 2-oxoglutarate and iron-dependent oxygenase domain-containing protein [Leptolyngbyaceae cyanobacterium bins.349]|nr:2-oxoglutarate and iron-dependent oxygenase domain-containing protein [Leptolyngbyaceae cyanobacterium bins.349]
MMQTIPVLDLHDFAADGDRRSQFISQLGAALEELGFFAMVNHGVDTDLIQKAYQVATQFFELPTNIKQTYEKPELYGQRGYTSFGQEHAKDHPVPDLKEFWHLGRDLPPDHPQRHQYPPNLAIAEVPDFHPVMTQLYTQLERCAADLLKACALYLGEPETLMAEMIQDGDTILRIIHYPPVAADVHPASLRSAPHEDINLITLLCEATDDGLELLHPNGTWLPIRAVPGQIIVDSGDMLQYLTNGVIKSTTHRVVNPTGDLSRRFSMPCFVHARKDVNLSPLPGCIAKTGTLRYPPITAGDYLMQRLREIGLAE